MITINITGFLTDFTAGRHSITLDGSPATVGEALTRLWELYPGLRDRVLTEQGQVRMHVNVFLEDQNIRRRELLATQLEKDSEITILPSVSGGCLESKMDEGRSLGFSIKWKELNIMKATWNGATLAESDQTVVVEGNHYFPADAIKKEYFQETSTHTTCPWKGEASYYSVVVAGEVNKDAAWYYPDPKPAAQEIRDHVAFWRGVKVEE